MKFSRLALTCAMASLLSAGSAIAQSQLRQPASVQRTAFEYSSYYAQEESPPSPSDKTPAATDAPAQVQPAPASGDCGCATDSCGGCDDCCGGGLIDRWLTLGGRLDTCCKLDEACKLFDNECLKCKKITIAGWLDQGFTGNFDSPRDRFNGPVSFNDRSNEYQMNQLYLYVEKPTDTQGCGWDVGYRTDLLWGTDSRFTLARGLDAQQDFTPRLNSGRFYGLAIPQSYMEFAYNDVKVKVGHFYTIIGYEVVTATGVFFYSHAMTHQYSEPFTHTGALATWTVDKELTISGGIVRGWDNWSETDNSGAFVGGFTLTSDDAKRSFAYATVFGDDPNINGGSSERFMQSVTYSSKLTDNWTYVFESDFGSQQNGKPQSSKNAYWYSTTNYLFYKVSDCFSWGSRFEWMRDEEGTRVAPVGDFIGSNVASVGGFAGNFYTITLGANWKPNGNTTVRPELRYDLFKGTALNGVQPYDSGNDNHQMMASFDVITTF